MEPYLKSGTFCWRSTPKESLDTAAIRVADSGFFQDGGIRLLEGNPGHSLITSSAVKADKLDIEAPAVVISHRNEFTSILKQGVLEIGCAIVARFQELPPTV